MLHFHSVLHYHDILIVSSSVKIKNFIEDLTFESSHAVQKVKNDFMCSVSAQNSLNLSEKNKSEKHIHNHQTLSKKSHYLRKVWFWTKIWNHKISLSSFYDIWYFLKSFVDWSENKLQNLILDLDSDSQLKIFWWQRSFQS